MINSILGIKKDMSQTFVEGYRVPVTKILAGPCVVAQVKKTEKDGYWAVQLGLGTRRIKNISKALQGHLKGVIKDNKAPRFLVEVRLDEEPKHNVGDEIKVFDIFAVGDVISATGISKGKGFAGVVKRHRFAGGPRTHGQSDRERAPGSIGQTNPGRVFKGKRMAGRMGGERVTIKGLHIISVDPDKNEVLVSGAIPGRKGSLVIINKISSGSLSELEHETITQQAVEGPSETAEASRKAPLDASEKLSNGEGQGENQK